MGEYTDPAIDETPETCSHEGCQEPITVYLRVRVREDSLRWKEAGYCTAHAREAITQWMAS